jgi:hypothetical protein
VTMEGVIRLFDRESLPEWVMEQYGYWDEGIVRGVQAVKDDAIVSANLARFQSSRTTYILTHQNLSTVSVTWGRCVACT